LVCVNLYPFLEKVKEDISFEEKIEFIDIGGPSMIRAAAKNFQDVLVLVSPDDYDWVLDKISRNEEISYKERKSLARKVFELTARYDSKVAEFLGSEDLFISSSQKKDLRYGENPDEKAQIFSVPGQGINVGKVLQGKEMSYNNFLDGDSALSLVSEFSDPTCAIIKHRNPCGVGSSDNILDAFKKALASDSKSAFGGIFAINKECSGDIAEELKNFFFEIFIAPSFSAKAKEIFAKKKNLRLLEIPDLKPENSPEIRSVGAGILKKFPGEKIDPKKFTPVSKKKPNQEELEDLVFSYKVCKHTISNAIAVVKNKTTLSICGGQTSRVDAVKISLDRAGDQAKGATLASDGFFPFADSMDLLKEYGISTCIAPGGSKRDQEVIDAADKYGISFIHADRRVFKH